MSKYSQLREDLRLQIEEGRFSVGERLCTEAELRQRYRVSANTVIRALRDLEHMGMVTRQRGKGTFVRSRRPANESSQRVRTLLLNTSRTLPANLSASPKDVNWFIIYELHRGVINSHAGPVRLVNDAEMRDALRTLAPEDAGLVVMDPAPETLDWLRGVATPWVVVERREQMVRETPNTVCLDRMRGICEGMFHLIQDLGHRDIAFVTTGANPHPLRMAGYMIGLNAHGIPLREELVARVDGDGSAEAGRLAVRGLLD
ncbi:MAG TPA: GntR family transcriptional regulator, partial [Anaerolineae bacterium]|nr:GntR family transcriptional regulator [Anaerolineae bacterium]